jgi:outer membrane protein OmpA-like peptidoglycan-associated protein
MNARTTTRLGLATLLLFSASAIASAADLTLNSVLYSGKEKSKVTFMTTDRAPKAKLDGAIEVKDNQAMIELSYSKLEPALLFGGDVNAWVVWAITPDGHLRNLGELPVREDRSGDVKFTSPDLNIAMIVTAEPFAGVRRPSDLVAFVSQPVKGKYVQNVSAAFTNMRMGTKRDVETIAGLEYKDKVPVELAQARRSIDLLNRNDAAKYAPKATEDAKIALAQANDAYDGRVGKKSDVPMLSQKAIVMATQAARETIKGMEAKQATEQEASRQAQLAALGAQATEAEQGRKAAEAQQAQTAASLAEVEKQRALLVAETTRLDAEKNKMKAERDALAQRLSGALGKVAQTDQTGRGLVLSLSGGVLFDTGQSVLKTGAKVSLAKLSGILLMIPDATIQVEGYTDNVGSDASNLKLSLARAQSVVAFLQAQGVEAGRMKSAGLGSATPVAANDTPANRSKNRRVEVVFANGADVAAN